MAVHRAGGREERQRGGIVTVMKYEWAGHSTPINHLSSGLKLHTGQNSDSEGKLFIHFNVLTLANKQKNPTPV